jgi:hypothetical protein
MTINTALVRSCPGSFDTYCYLENIEMTSPTFEIRRMLFEMRLAAEHQVGSNDRPSSGLRRVVPVVEGAL